MRPFLATFSVLALLLAPAPAFARATAEQEVLAALDLWSQALVKKDRSAFEKVLHPDLTYGHSSGLVETKGQAIRHVLESTAVWERVHLDDTKVHVHGDTALVTGRVEYHQRSKDKVTVIELRMLTVWLKGPHGWQMIARQATRPEIAVKP